MSSVQPIRPELTEQRLNEMQAHASQVWKGLRTPKLQQAQDVLFLVAEVRLLRKKLEEKEEESIVNRPFGNVFQSKKVPSEYRDAGQQMEGILNSFRKLFRRGGT